MLQFHFGRGRRERRTHTHTERGIYSSCAFGRYDVWSLCLGEQRHRLHCCNVNPQQYSRTIAETNPISTGHYYFYQECKMLCLIVNAFNTLQKEEEYHRFVWGNTDVIYSYQTVNTHIHVLADYKPYLITMSRIREALSRWVLELCKEIQIVILNPWAQQSDGDCVNMTGLIFSSTRQQGTFILVSASNNMCTDHHRATEILRLGAYCLLRCIKM